MGNRDIGEKLQHVGGVLIGGFGAGIILGMFRGYLSDATPDSCFNSILHNESLWNSMTEDDWTYYASIIKEYRINPITYERVVKDLRKHRLDLLSTIINTTGGEKWLQSQVKFVQDKLWPQGS